MQVGAEPYDSEVLVCWSEVSPTMTNIEAALWEIAAAIKEHAKSVDRLADMTKTEAGMMSEMRKMSRGR